MAEELLITLCKTENNVSQIKDLIEAFGIDSFNLASKHDEVLSFHRFVVLLCIPINLSNGNKRSTIKILPSYTKRRLSIIGRTHGADRRCGVWKFGCS